MGAHHSLLLHCYSVIRRANGCRRGMATVAVHPPRATTVRATPLTGGGAWARLYASKCKLTRCYDSKRMPNLAIDAIDKADYPQFVRFLHLASPYVVGHRSRTFVIVIPGEVVVRKERLVALLEDILLLHGLGVQVVIVVGGRELIDDAIRRQGREPVWEGAYRVTDADTMRAAIETAGAISTEISATLSRAPALSMVRRHARGEGRFHFAPAVQVVTGNYVTAKRRGIINGADFGFMGQVRFVQREAIVQQLAAGNIVLLTNVGVSAAGELLNCNSYDVATHAAVELRADKLLCLTGSDVRGLQLPHYLPLDDAEALIQASQCVDGDEECLNLDSSTGSVQIMGRGRVFDGAAGEDTGDEDDGGWTAARWNGRLKPGDNGNGAPQDLEMLLDLDSWQQIGYPTAVVAAVVACRGGVNRAHLIDFERDGAMLLELYTRDGITGVCMIAADLYEGIRPAEADDAGGISRLLGMLASEGHELPFPPTEAIDNLKSTTVVAREGRVLGCAAVVDLGMAPDGVRVAEVGALIIDPGFRRQGLGDSLLDYVEQGLRQRGFRRVVLVAEQGSYEWFTQRAFELTGDATTSELIPEKRRSRVPLVSKLYAKPILELDASLDATPGKRIGF